MMKFRLFDEFTYFCSAEGDDGGDGGGSGGDGTPPARPDGLADKFWNETTGVDVAGLSKSYNELQVSSSAARDTIRGEVEAERFANRPPAADKYDFKLPDNVEVPQGYSVELKPDHPLVGFWRETAFENGLDQAGFEKGVATYFQHMIADLPDITATATALGERGQERMDRARDYMKGIVGEDGFGVLGNLVVTPEGIAAVEKMMDKAGAPPLGDSTYGSQDGGDEDNPANTVEFDAKTKKMQEEAFSENDPVKKEAMTKEVRARFQKRHPGNQEPERNAPRGR